MLDTKPKGQCWEYFAKRGTGAPEMVTQLAFDAHFDAGDFADGPFRDSFGDGYGEPYNPYRQAFGTLKDGRGVYACLWPTAMEAIA